MNNEWLYEEDTGTLMSKCPACSCRMIIGKCLPFNPYNYCPYCGKKLEQGRFNQKRREVYGYAGY